jgi:hypothetical protein
MTLINLKRIWFISLALTLNGKPSGLKDYNNLNKVDINKVKTDNVLFFINHITMNK